MTEQEARAMLEEADQVGFNQINTYYVANCPLLWTENGPKTG